MYKLGLSSCGFELNEANFKALNENKIDYIEVSMAYDKYADIDYKNIKELAEKYNVGLWSYHLPFLPFSEVNIASLESFVRENTIKYFTELILKASNIGIDKFVIHPSGEPIPNSERQEHIKFAKQSLNELSEIAAKCGAVIAVEDLPRTCLGKNSDEILDLISANNKLRVCFDTNHLLGEDNINFMKKVAEKIVTVHISDYDFLNERHWLPGEGKLNWNEMYNTFKEIGYNGAWMYEVRLESPKSIIRDRNLEFADFYNNANEIFLNKTPTAVGTPKPNLGKW